MRNLTSGSGSAASQSGVTAAALQGGFAASPLGGASNRSLGLKAAALLFGLAVLVLLPGTHVTLLDRDEGWYAQVCREMLSTGDWLVPRLQGEVWLAKPPLTYWLVAASFRLFGVGEWQARLTPLLLMAASVVLVAGLGARLYGRRIGALAGVLFITAGLPALVGKMLLTDQVMLLCTLTALHLHWRIAEAERQRHGDKETRGQGDGRADGQWDRGMEGRGEVHWQALAYWLFIGLGMLAKGPATLVFAGAFGLALLATPGRRAWFFDWRYWLWLPVALLVAGPWYVYIARSAGGTLVSQFFGYEIASRIAGTPHGHGGPPGYYIILSLAGLLPWTVFVPGTLIIAFRRCLQEPGLRLLLIWLAVPWIILELIHSKLPHYILPCYVPLMILMARMLDEGLQAGRPKSAYPRNEQRVLGLWPAVMVGMGVAIILAAAIRWDPRWGWAATAAGAVLVLGFILVERMLRRSFTRAFVTAVGATVAFQAVLGVAWLPALEPLRLSRNLAVRINSVARPGELVRICGYEEPSMFFYLEGPARSVKPDALEGLLSASDQPVLLAISQRVLSADPDHGGLPPEMVARLTQRFLPEPVKGFNYVKMWEEEIRLARLP